MKSNPDTGSLIKSKLKQYLHGSLDKHSGRSSPATHTEEELQTTTTKMQKSMSYGLMNYLNNPLFSSSVSCMTPTSPAHPPKSPPTTKAARTRETSESTSEQSMSISDSSQEQLSEELSESEETSSEISEYSRLKSLMSEQDATDYEAITKRSKDILHKVVPLMESDEDLKKLLDDFDEEDKLYAVYEEELEDIYYRKPSEMTLEDRPKLINAMKALKEVTDVHPPTLNVAVLFTPLYRNADQTELVEIFACINSSRAESRRIERLMACCYDINVVKIAISLEKARRNTDERFLDTLNKK